jgi:hypothetical protein
MQYLQLFCHYLKFHLFRRFTIKLLITYVHFTALFTFLLFFSQTNLSEIIAFQYSQDQSIQRQSNATEKLFLLPKKTA